MWNPIPLPTLLLLLVNLLLLIIENSNNNFISFGSVCAQKINHTTVWQHIYLSEFPRKSPTVVNYCLFSSKFTVFFHATLQSAYISKSKHLFCKILQGIMVQYVKYSMCENHENTLKFEGTGTLYFKVHEMVVLM